MRRVKAKYVFAVCLAVFLICISTAGITMAYLSTAPGTAKNVITVGKVKIRLWEEKWDYEKGQELHPKACVEKDPVIENTGENPAYVFLEVSVPMRDIITVDQDGKKKEPGVCELFTYQADEANWELIEQKIKKGQVFRVYGYRSLLNPAEKTEPLFTEVAAVNYLEGSIDASETFVIGITAKAIQNQVDTADQTLRQIYEELLGQTEENSLEGKEETEYEG